MGKQFFPAKLLLSIINKGGGRVVVDGSKAGGARGGTRTFGRGVLGGDASAQYTPQDIVMTLMWDEMENVINAVVGGVLQCPDELNGAALVIDVPKALTEYNVASANAAIQPSDKGNVMIQSGFMMIVTITNHGEAEALMDAARKAGARGGTIIGGRGTGTEDDLKYFGISLASEKEILLIVADGASAKGILDELSSQPVFNEPGGGIIFTTEVERFISLANRLEGSF